MADCMTFPDTVEELITTIQTGIKATDADDVCSCGMRNGMRWCLSLIDGKEPLYENCPSAQPEIIRCKDCKHFMKWRTEKSAKKFGQEYEYECECGRLNVPKPDDFCSRPKRKGEPNDLQ